MDKLPEHIKALVFDLDDTLYPEVNYVYSGFRSVSRQIALHDPNLEGQTVYELLVDEFENGQDRRRVFNIVLEKLNQRSDDQVIAELVSLYRCHRPTIDLEPSIRDMLEKLRYHFRLGLITDGTLPGQKLKVEALGIQDLFDHIIYTELLGRENWKPSSLPFENMSKALACQSNECVYIGDNPAKDFVAPNQLGWHTIEVHSPQKVHTHVDIPENGSAKNQLPSIHEFMNLV